ncbi:MAG: hypothetical protein IPM51_11895 [Sphingobacteriaceae bacterium]|nr:hypothetical protein [Sphingobacteriaceae bacterium]
MGLISSPSNEPLLADLDYDNLSAMDQAKVNSLIEVGSQLIEAYCNRVFTAADFTEYLDGNGHNEIYVKNPPINSITSVTINSNLVDYVFPTDELTIKPGIGRVNLNLDKTNSLRPFTHFPRGSQNIKVIYNGAFNPIPAPILLVLADFVIRAFDGIGESGNVVSEKLGQYFYKLKDDKTKVDKNISQYEGYLQYYKIRRV